MAQTTENLGGCFSRSKVQTQNPKYTKYPPEIVEKYLVYTRGEYADGFYITSTLKQAADYLDDFYKTGNMKEGWIKSLTHKEYMEMRI